MPICSLRTAMSVPTSAFAAILLLLLASGCGGKGPSRPANVVLISIDTLRADHLSCYGYERETSPNIDRLSRNGVRCAETFSTTSWTMPAHLSMLSGLEISAHGMCDERLLEIVARPGPPDELPLRGTFVAEVLQRRGYATGGFYTWKYLEERFGFGHGFDTWERCGHSIYSHPDYAEEVALARSQGDRATLERLREEVPELFDDQRPTAKEATDKALSWVEEQGEAPFFLFLHLFDVHDDYVAPEPFRSLFDNDYTGPIDGRRVSTANTDVHPGMKPRDLAHLIACYDEEIAWVDSQIGRLVERLDELGLTEDTLVILTSDHGEEFFEHGHKTHRTHLFNESTHVPLIFTWPGNLPAGEVVEGPTGIVDIASTIYALLDVGAPPSISGSNLAPALRGESTHAERKYLTELLVFESSWSPTRIVGLYEGDEHWIYTRTPGVEPKAVHFDLETNFEEVGFGREIDLASEEGHELLSRLDVVRDRARETREAAPPRNAEAQPLSDAEWDELMAVGYAGGPEGEVGTIERVDRLAMDGSYFPVKD